MNIINTKLDKIKELGLRIHDNNHGYTVSSEPALKYAEKYLALTHVYNDDYVLGCVPADTEDLTKVEYNVCFNVTEEYYEGLTSDMYHSLHELAEQNDTVAFREYLDKLHKQFYGEDEDSVYSAMSEAVRDTMNDIEKELDDIIEALGGTAEDISRIQHEMAEGYQKYIRKTAPWILGE